MEELKTQATDADVQAFLTQICTPARLSDCQTLVAMMQAATGQAPVMWGTSVVGFGRYRYRYASGREGLWPVIGFSPRKQDLTLYIVPCEGALGFSAYPELMARLGKYRTGKSCLYINRAYAKSFQLPRRSALVREGAYRTAADTNLKRGLTTKNTKDTKDTKV